MTEDSSLSRNKVRDLWVAKTPFWTATADDMARMADKMNQPFLDAVGVGPGDMVLDLASGAGEPALGAAQRVGDAGGVVATDIVPDMLARVRERAARQRVGNLRTVVADAETLPFPAAGFDRVTCRFGLMFISDVPAALAEVLRVLRPGGRAGFLVWGPLEDNALFQVMRDALLAVLGLRLDGTETAQFRFGAPDSAAGPMRQAGFVRVAEEERRPVRNAPAEGTFWQTNLMMSCGLHLRGRDAATLDRLDRVIRAGFAAYRDGGSYRLPVHFRIVTGETPG